VILHTRSGSSFSGILTSFDFQPPSNDLALILSHVLPHPLPQPAPPAKKQMIIQPKDISSISALSASLAPSTQPSGFRIDTAISANQTSTQRQLERWQPDQAHHTGMSGHLEEAAKSGSWDQFATNEKMFGLKSSYSEELYTTKLDRSHPEFAKRYRAAESIAREIEGKVSSNPHIMEERGLKVDDSGVDEEDKYAGVIRTQAPQSVLGYAAAAAGGKYTPPAKREALAQQVKAADPAIVSTTKPTTPKPAEKPIEKQVDAPSEKPATPTTSENPTPKPADKPSLALPLPPSTNGNIPIVVKEPDDTTPQIQEASQKFVKEEKVKIKRARNLIGTKEKQRQLNEFAEFSQSLHLTMPVPTDLLPILAGKDANRQKQILERNQELKRRHDGKQTSPKPATPASVASVTSPPAQSPITSPTPTLAERLRSNQTRTPGSVPSPIASPTPLEPGTIKPPQTATTKNLNPGAKEFVFKPGAKEFKPSFTPSTHSPSPSRSTVVSPPPPPVRPRADRPEEKQSVPKPGFWDKKPRRKEPRESISSLNPLATAKMEFKPSHEGEQFSLAPAYATQPYWPYAEADGQKGYFEVLTEGKSHPATPSLPGQDDQSQSGHSYSRSSSVHPVNPTPHQPQALPVQPPVMQGFAPGPPMYPPMNAVAMQQFGYMIPPGQQLALHPQQGVPQTQFTPQLMPGQFQQHQQGSPYRYQQQGYQSVSPSPLMTHAIPAQYQPQPGFPNGQFPPGFQAPMYQPMPPYGFVPQQQQNGAFSGHPSPGRGNTAQMVFPPMQMQMQQMYGGTLLVHLILTTDMRQFPPQGQIPFRTPPQPAHIPPHQYGHTHSPSRNGSYASASASAHGTPSHSRRQSTQPPPPPDEEKS